MSQPVIGTPWQKLNGSVSNEALDGVERYWRASNYLSVGQIYLRSNPLMRSGWIDEKSGEQRDFCFDDIKPRLMGHWGTIPGINFLLAHINRLIADHGQNTIFLMGPGHGAPAGTSQALLDGTYREVCPELTDDEAGLTTFFRRYSQPGGVPSHYSPRTPGSIQEGGELGYTLSHAFGAALDNPSLLSIAIVGDGEAETAPIATAWHTNKLMNPKSDGIVLPILHLNGYKITNPSIFARMAESELEAYFHGMGYMPHVFTAGFDDEPIASIHRRFGELLEHVFDHICDIKAAAQAGDVQRPMYPMIVFRTPKGWTCPKYIDESKVEGSWRTHQVPLEHAKTSQDHFDMLREWLCSYEPEDLFTPEGKIRPEVTNFMPTGDLRLGANPNVNAGAVREALVLPDAAAYEVAVDRSACGAGSEDAGVEAAYVYGQYTRDVLAANPDNFRVFCPDEIASNRLQAVCEVTNKQFAGNHFGDAENDEFLSRSGKLIEQLSEHQCEGLLEGYLLTGRHGMWSSYESFAQVVASMVGQHCKWLEVTKREVPWRRPLASLNMMLTSHVWRQDHNGFTHQDPGFIDVLLNKNNDTHVVHAYYPCDANMALAVAERTYASVDCVNAIFCGKQPAPTFVSLDDARKELEVGAAAWKWASTAPSAAEADVVIATCGDVPTLEALAVTDMLRKLDVRVWFANIVDLLKIQSVCENDQAMSDAQFTEIFGDGSTPVLCCFHAYAGTVRRLIWGRPGREAWLVHGYEEQGTTTTPFDMLRLNNMDRWKLASDALRLVDAQRHAEQITAWEAFRTEAYNFAVNEGYDHPAFTSWSWNGVKEI